MHIQNIKRILNIFRFKIFAFLFLVLWLINYENSPFHIDRLCEELWCFPSKWPQFVNGLVGKFGEAGFLAVFFYWLLVCLPEYEKRERVKKNLNAHYKFFKTECIKILMAVANDSVQVGEAERLLNPKMFNEYFQENIEHDMSRWDAVHNNMDQYQLNKILAYLDILKEEISSAMQKIDLTEGDAFNIFRSFSRLSIYYNNTDAESRDLKYFLNDLGKYFYEFDLDEGESIQKMIECI